MIQTPRSEQAEGGGFTFYIVLAVLWLVPGLLFLLATAVAGGAPHTRVVDWPYAAIRSIMRGHGRVVPWEWVGAPGVRSSVVFWAVVALLTVPMSVGTLVAAVALRGGIPAVFPFLSQPPARSRWARSRSLSREGLAVGGATGRARLVLGRHRGRVIAASEGTSVLALGTAGSGKSAGLCIPAIADWDGCVVAVSDGTDLIEVAAGLRQHRGRVDVLDLSGRTGLATCTWSPSSRRMEFDAAVALVAQVLEGREPEPDEATRQVLTCLLYAAANRGLGVAAAIEWLDDLSGAALVRSLLQVTDRDPRATSWATRIVERGRDQRAACFSAARQLLRSHFHQAAPGAPANAIQPGEFVNSAGGTLFVVTPTEPSTAPGALASLLGDLVREAERGRQRRPLLLVLDGCAAVAPMPGLADHLASRSSSVTVLAALRDPEDCAARAGWNVAALADLARAVVVLGGAGEGSLPGLMHRLVRRQLARPAGPRTGAAEGDLEPDMLPPEAARQLGHGRALLVHRRLAPAVLWTRNCYEDAELQQLLQEHPYVRGVARIDNAS